MPKPGAPPSFDAPSKVLANFTDRESQQETFRRLIGMPAGSSLPVVMFYGVGGIGKTWLLSRLRQVHAVPAEIPTATIDFSRDPGTNGERFCSDAALTLATIRQQFKVECPRFDLAYAMLRYKQGAGSEPTLKGSSDAAIAWDIVLDFALAPFPGGSVFAKLIGRGVKATTPHFKKTALYKWLAEANGEKDLPKLLAQTEQEIMEELAVRLRDDLASALLVNDGFACRGVVFLDTYESLTYNISGDAQQEVKERWVRNLCATLDACGILFVIAGQNRLTWGEIDKGWHDETCLEQHLVGGLSGNDARKFLAKCSVDDLPLQNAILEFSHENDGGYHTWSLGLCADVCVSERGQSITTRPETLSLRSGDLNALALRFLKSLHSPEQEAWIKALALTPRFDAIAACALHAGTPLAQKVAWENLLDYSFVAPIENTEWFTIRLQMCEALQRVAVSSELQVVHQYWSNYWSGRRSDSIDDYAALHWFHLWHLSPDVALSQWKSLCVMSRDGNALNMALHYRLLDWWSPLTLILQSPKDTNSFAAIYGFAEELLYTTLGDRSVTLRRAISYYQSAISFYEISDFSYYCAAAYYGIGYAYQQLPTGSREYNLQQAIFCSQQSISFCTRHSLFPEIKAQAQVVMGDAYVEIPSGDNNSNIRQAIAYYKDALQIYTKDKYSYEWASTQQSMAYAYLQIKSGVREANVWQAIILYQEIFDIYTKDAYPVAWASVQNDLAIAFFYLPSGDRESNIQQAIVHYQLALQIRTELMFPQNWAMTCNNIGNAYREYTFNDRDANIHQAIIYYEAALRVQNEFSYPLDWAQTQNNMGLAYFYLAQRKKEGAMESAISCFEAALRVRTKAEFPKDWALTQVGLGDVYAHSISVNQDENFNNAMFCYQEALKILTKEVFPEYWATILHNIGVMYMSLPSGDRDANLKQAINFWSMALQVRTKFALPWAWLDTQLCIAEAFRFLKSDDRNSNLEQAIASYQALFDLVSETEKSAIWSTAHFGIATAYVELTTGNRDDNLKQAILSLHESLKIKKEIDSPNEWAAIQNSMGIAYSELSFDKNSNLTRSIVCYREALRVYSSLNMSEDCATVNINLGLSYYAMGSIHENIDFFSKASYIYRSIGKFHESKELDEAIIELSSSLHSNKLQ